ncbi:MAG: ferritin-like domain-containing protein [Bryobacterales bacterium]|nr:ferritin-like domain-containing protein [Bryobacterales bacterium]MBV9397744.1 ferritin-like domain-containing protein [Bryobacterales bacterium]
MKIEKLETLLEEELKDIYDAEKRLVRALPKMAKAASSADLRAAFEEHLEVTKTHVERLEQVFKQLGIAAKAKPCAGMKGLLEEGDEVLGKDATETLMDAALIGAAQRVEHYEIAAYGTVRAFAERLGQKTAVKLLQETLDEEKEADEKLTAISEQMLATVDGEPKAGEASSAGRGHASHSKARG